MTANSHNKRARMKKIALWSFLTIVLGAMLAPLSGYVYVALTPAHAQSAEDTNPRANYWRAVREGYTGYSAVKGQETNVLIQNGGHNWRQWRNGPLATIGPWVMIGILAAILLYHAWHGPVKLEGSLSGERVPRWSLFERNLHWINAVMFILLAITGLSLLFGRAVLIPIFGPEGFAAWAEAAMGIHNLIGPAFLLTIALIIVVWMRNNIPQSHDWTWLKQAGGMFSKGQHPHAGKANAGEKVWFWILCTVGVAVCVTGVILDFPNFGQTRETMQIANLIHGASAVLWIAVAIGHIYLGTVGTPGAFEGMSTGYVSKEWAQAHHDLWYEEIKHKSVKSEPSTGVTGGSAPTS